MTESKFVKANELISEKVVSGYKKVEDAVVEGYKTMEDAVVEGYKTVENAFVGRYLTHEGESAEEAKARLLEKQREHQAIQSRAYAGTHKH